MIPEHKGAEYTILDISNKRKEISLLEEIALRETIQSGIFALAGAAFGIGSASLCWLEGANVFSIVGSILSICCIGNAIEDFKDKNEILRERNVALKILKKMEQKMEEKILQDERSM